MERRKKDTGGGYWPRQTRLHTFVGLGYGTGAEMAERETRGQSGAVFNVCNMWVSFGGTHAQHSFPGRPPTTWLHKEFTVPNDLNKGLIGYDNKRTATSCLNISR